MAEPSVAPSHPRYPTAGEYDDAILWMLSLTSTERLGCHDAVLPILYRTLQLKQAGKTPPDEK